jgi:hypothetical protein
MSRAATSTVDIRMRPRSGRKVSAENDGRGFLAAIAITVALAWAIAACLLSIPVMLPPAVLLS